MLRNHVPPTELKIVWWQSGELSQFGNRPIFLECRERLYYAEIFIYYSCLITRYIAAKERPINLFSVGFLNVNSRYVA